MRAVAALAITLLLAGCAAKPDAAPEPVADFTDLDLAATATTGLIRGIVVDEAIRPVPDVKLTLQTEQGPREATSADDGAFGFDDLPGGTYFIQAAKPGFAPAQTSTDVVAGVAEPPVVKVLLVLDPGTRPFFEAYNWDGFIECSARAILLGVAACEGVGNDDIAHDIDLTAGIPTFAQGELIWESTQALGDELSFNWRKTGTNNDYIDTEGPSPLLLQANYTLFEENDVGAGEPLRTVIFTGHNPATEPPGGLTWGVGVQLQQKFTLYLHVFYNFQPAEGWKFSVDGDPVAPA
jgi:hypothetical protein